MSTRDYLTPEAIEMLDSLSDEQRADVESGLDSMIENVPDLQEGELDVYRSDNDTKGRLFTVNYHDDNSNVGSIYLKNDQIQIRMNPDRELLREEAR
ncbi:MAG: hypothetical protein IJ167_00915, partial [Lachnospiraceae bacterium]|nr:hypothetical protein [Lachnospiraceae bacterium]